MTKKQADTTEPRGQLERFREAARELACDESEERFRATVESSCRC